MVHHRDIVGTQCRHLSYMDRTLFIRRSCCSGDIIRMGVSSAMGFEGDIMDNILLRIIHYLAMAWMWIATTSSIFFFFIELHIVPRTRYISTFLIILAGFAEAFCAFCIYVNRNDF